jgi:hypothetical protein
MTSVRIGRDSAKVISHGSILSLLLLAAKRRAAARKKQPHRNHRCRHEVRQAVYSIAGLRLMLAVGSCLDFAPIEWRSKPTGHAQLRF